MALENGTVFTGIAFGDENAEAQGEVVFNTAMTGYQEAMTDPSYKGQILTFTYPHIGNTGVNSFDVESDSIKAEGIIVKEVAKTYSNWRAEKSLSDYLKEEGRIGIEGIDTRELVRVLRSEGAMRGIISASGTAEELVERAKNLPSMAGLNLADVVTTKKAYTFEPVEGDDLLAEAPEVKTRYNVAAFDFGIKRNILRRLHAHGCNVTVYPASTSAEEILATNPDGVFLSNGPGDPEPLEQAQQTIRDLMGKKPIFGICLGHQLIGLACGASSYKLKFGHRGANHPVKNLLTGAIEITSQNHGFAIDLDSMPDELELTHVNLNDNTVSGLRHRTVDMFCVQYHPESSPGTHDSEYLFAQFVEMMAAKKI